MTDDSQDQVLAQLEVMHDTLLRMEKHLEWLSGFEQRAADRQRELQEISARILNPPR